MTRGKYAARARNRRDLAEVDQAIESYQRKIREQLGEIEKLRGEVASLKINHETAARRLIAQRDEGVSPRLEVVQREAVTLREERDTALADAREIRKRWGRIIDRLRTHAEDDHGMTWLESAEWLVWLVGADQSVTIVEGFMKDLIDKYPGQLDDNKLSEMVIQIERARGNRSPKREP